MSKEAKNVLKERDVGVSISLYLEQEDEGEDVVDGIVHKIVLYDVERTNVIDVVGKAWMTFEGMGEFDSVVWGNNEEGFDYICLPLSKDVDGECDIVSWRDFLEGVVEEEEMSEWVY